MISKLTLVGTLAFLITPFTFTLAQETSVKPGINDSFRNPSTQKYIETFEIESREVFALREQIVRACNITPGSTVADIGAGTGLFTRLFSEKVGPNGKVFAVDIAQNFLDHITKTGRELGQLNVETILCKDDSTELPENSVDLAFICDTYHHFEFPQKTMQSLHKALKPGGRVVVVDFRRLEGKSSPWVLNHVRAGEEVVEAEIRASGFRKAIELPAMLTENYFVVFQKLQPSEGLKTPLIAGVGGVEILTGAAEPPRTGAKVVFDVTSSVKPGEITAGLERTARLLNLYAASGLSPDDVSITVVLHGDAAAACVVDTPDNVNANLPLIAELAKNGVDIFVCGQTLARKKIPSKDVCEGVVISTSAMTTLINRQSDGYSVLRVSE